MKTCNHCQAQRPNSEFIELTLTRRYGKSVSTLLLRTCHDKPDCESGAKASFQNWKTETGEKKVVSTPPVHSS